VQFRLCREAEYDQVRRLWGECFGNEEPWTSWYFSKHYQADHTWVGERDGEIIAQAHLLPHRLMVRGTWREAAFLVGVCVSEKMRGRGIGRELLSSALEELRRTGMKINILQPRWPEFYRQLGWEFCYDRQSYKLPVHVADLLLPDVAGAFFWEPDLADISVLSGLYCQFTLSRHGYARREEKDWEILLADHKGDSGRVGVVFRSEVPCAYVLYSMAGDLLRVRELVWTDTAAVDAIWKYLIGLSGPAALEKLEWLDPAGNPVSLLSSGSHPEPFLMGRMNDMQAILSEIDYPAEQAADIRINVSDPLISSNNGFFRWRISNGHGRLTPSRQTRTPAISIGIGQLSQLLFGYRTVQQLLEAGTASVSNVETIALLEQIFPVCRNYISEYF